PQWTDADREALGGLQASNASKASNSSKTCLRNLQLCRNWRPTFMAYVNGPTSTLPSRERELLRLRSFFLDHSDYGWAEHWHTGYSQRQGVTQEEALRITKGPQAREWNPFDRTLLLAVDELQGGRIIQDATWKALAERF